MKHSITFAIAASALAVSCFASQAQAAEPGFCRRYAGAAVEAFARIMQSPCAGEVHYPRWSPNYEQHFGWCLSAAPWDVQHEWEARSRRLAYCAGG